VAPLKRFFSPLIISTVGSFHGQKTVAPLKPFRRRIRFVNFHQFPWSKDRGPIEAFRPCSSSFRPQSFHGQKTVAPLKLIVHER